MNGLPRATQTSASLGPTVRPKSHVLVGIDADGYSYRKRNDSPGLAHLYVRRFDPKGRASSLRSGRVLLRFTDSQ